MTDRPSGPSSEGTRPSIPKRLRIPGLSLYWQNFLYCVILHLALPLLPILFEQWLTGEVGEKTITLAASLYHIAIGVSSRNKALFAATIAISIVNSFAYGILVTKSAPPAEAWYVGAIGIGAIFLVHLFERFNRHVIEREPFPSS